MCSRVLGARKWSRPGRVGAGCDARVLGMHAAHVGVCTGARVCRGQGKRNGFSRGGSPCFDQSIAKGSMKEAEAQLESGPVETTPS